MRNKKILIAYLLILVVSCGKKQTKPSDSDYTNFKILKLTLSKIPFENKNSNDWDILDGPDVFFNMERSDGSVLFKGSNLRCNDLTGAELPYSWDIVPAYEITNIEAIQFVVVYDYDTFDLNDEIGYVGLTISDYKKDYPERITKTQNGVTITIEGKWY